MAHDVFISHSAKDKPVADAVCATLEKGGVRCWIAPRDIVPGTQWGEAIIDAISSSRVMVLVFSSNANESQQIIREVERAVSKGIPVIPFRVEDVDPNKSLEYFISAPHWLDALTPPLEKHLAQLLSTIKLLLSRMGARAESGADENAAGVSGASQSGSERAYQGPDQRMETIRPLEKKDYSGGRSFLEDKRKLVGLIAVVVVLGLAGYLIFGGGDKDGKKNDQPHNIIGEDKDYRPPVYTPSPPGPYDNEGNWGSIAVAPSGGYGFSTNMPSKQAAEKDAVERCSQFNTVCEIKVSFNTCAVYATAPDGAFGWATNSTVDLARNNAVSECHKYTNDVCSSFIELCSDGSTKRVNVWAAIATADNGRYGTAWNYPTRVQAEKAAVGECVKYGPNCQMRISFTDCGAVARSEDGALGWGYYADMDEAVKAAKDECGNRSKKPCSILTQLCADGSNLK